MRTLRVSPVLLLTLPLAACATGTGEPVDAAAAEAEVRAASEAVVEAEKAMDADGALAHWADDAVVHMEGMPAVRGKEGMRGVYESFFQNPDFLAFDASITDIDVAPGGGLAWEHGVNHFTFRGPDGPFEVQGKYLAVWRETDEGWKLSAVAATNDTPLPAGASGEEPSS